MEETRGGGEEVERIRVVVIHEGKKMDWERRGNWSGKAKRSGVGWILV